jgi:ubiquinone biosynthesis protein UbiJ
MSYTFKTGVSDSIIARLVLLANHVIASEPAATARLRPHAGRQMELRFNHQANWPLARVVQGWLPTRVRLGVTPAGLLEWAPPPQGAEEPPLAPGSLTITIQVPDPVNAVKLALKRERPEVSIDGDVAFAEVVSWLMKNLRWDLEDDLARWLGSTPTQLLKALADNVRAALSRLRPSSGKMPGPFSR